MDLRTLACWALLPACIETGLRPDVDGYRPSQDTAGGGGRDGGPDPEPEVCNGRDDDLDGRIDEGFPDVDLDGVADCRDEACEVRVPGAEGTTRDDACLADLPEVDDPWDLDVEWAWRREPSVSTPVVGHLDDDDGSGIIGDDGDIPEIVFTTVSTGELVALRGDGRGVAWRLPGFRADSGVAIADLDGDGAPEVLAITADQRVRAVGGEDGAVRWTSPSTYPFLYPVPTVADLDQDGSPEVIADVAVLGFDGTPRWTLDLGVGGPWRAPVVADLDGDGLKEILLGGVSYGADGVRRWSTPDGGAISAFAALVQADDDPQAEVAWAIGPNLNLHEANGRILRSWALPGGNRPGPPCAGDLDADGETELVVPSARSLTAFQLDGTARWSLPINDSSGASGCVVFDMDGDGAYEVLYADMESLLVVDGRSGSVRYRDREHGSVTYFETPTVADVDGDGSAEIVVVASGSEGVVGVTVFGHREDGWPSAGPGWPVHDYQVDNVGPAGEVPAVVPPSWTRWGLFRGRPATSRARLPDLEPEIVDVCVASCAPGGLMRLAWRVHNRGVAPSPPGVAVALNLAGPNGPMPYLRTTIPEVQPGRTTGTAVFEMPWTRMPAAGLHLVVDPDGRVEECEEHDNTAVWDDRLCAP